MTFSKEEISQAFRLKEAENGVIHFAFARATNNSEESTSIAKHIKAELESILQHYGKHEALLLVELTSEDGIVSKNANSIYKHVLDDPRIMRMAIYGGLPKYRNIARVLLPLTGKNRIKVFKTKPEAMHWLIND